MGGGFLYPTGTLPPPEVRLIDPSNDQSLRIVTPLDSRDLIDISQLITDVKATIDPDYQWPSEASVHHFYWPDSLYPSKPGRAGNNPALFKNLPIHKGLVPRVFENWLHKVTLPPPIPEPEVRQYRVEAWTVAKDLFKMARKTVQWEKMARRRRELIARNPHIIKDGFDGSDLIGEEVMHEIMERNFRGFERQLNRQDRIPVEHRLIELGNTPARVATDLGKLVNRSSLRLVHEIAS